MRRLLLISFSGLVWLASGCTASDRDYVRNHIVLLENHSRSQPVTPLNPLPAASSPTRADI